MKKILVLVPFAPAQRRQLAEAAPGWEFLYAKEDAAQQTLPEGVEIVIGEPQHAAIAAAPELKWVQMTWAGTDKYTAAPEPFPAGVALTNASGAFGPIMSEYALGAVLTLYHRFPAYLQNQRQERWEDAGAERSLRGKHALIFGAGDVGRCTAEKLSFFGAHVTGVRRRVSEVPAGFERLVSLEAAEGELPKADIVVCCIPNSAATAGYFGARRLALLKEDAVLVNMGRGSFVDAQALARRLEQFPAFSAALDVTDPEPLPEGHPLWKLENVLITPHVAGPSFGHCPDTEARICEICCGNLRRWLAGQPLKNRVL